MPPRVEPVGDALTFIGARVWRSTNQTISNNSLTVVSFDKVIFDTAGMWVPGQPTRLTIPCDGYWDVGAIIEWNSGSATRSRYIDIAKNGAGLRVAEGAGGWATNASDFAQCTAATTAKLFKGDYLEVRGIQNSGGNVDIFSETDAIAPCFWATLRGV